MSTSSQPRWAKTLVAEADYTAVSNLYKAVVVFDSTLPNVQASYKIVGVAEAGGRIAGFLWRLANQGDFCEVAANGGGSKAVAGAAITAGQYLEVDANGDLIPLALGEAVALAQSDALTGDIFSVDVI